MPPKHFFTFGPFLLDADEQRLLREGRAVPLPPKAFDTLLVLVGQSGHILMKDELMKQVWPETYVEENNLQQSISALRKVLEDGAGESRYIETVPRRGYRFTARVEEYWDAKTESALEDLTSFAPPAVRSIAVLPFKPLVEASRDEVLEMGMADTLITRLSNIRQINVRPMSAVRKYANIEQDAAAAGREQLVDAVIEGSIQRSGDAVRVTVRLVRVTDVSVIWTGQFDQKFTDIFALQDAISERVAGALTMELTGHESARLTKRHTDNTEAYRLYLMGRYYLGKYTEEAGRKSIEYFNQALEKDPGYALAYAGLADCYVVLGTDTHLPPKEVMPKAKAYAVKALEIDDTLAEAHASLGTYELFYGWDWIAAERELKRALDLNPSFAGAHELYSYFLAAMGRHREAIAEMERALELDPLSLVINADLGMAYYFARQHDQAIKQSRKAIEMDPNFVIAHLFIGWAYEQKKMYEEATAELNKARTLSGSWARVVAELGHVYAASGQRGEAHRLLHEMKGQAKRGHIDSANIALIYTGLGERDQALQWLEKAYEERSPWIPWLNVEPKFDHLRSDPRLLDLLRRMNLTP